MKNPTNKELIRWWNSLPKGEYTCTDCGKKGPESYVQPQHPYYVGGKKGVALCSDCIKKQILEGRKKRKAQIDATPRCEVSVCKRRGAWKMLGVLLCGPHKKRVQKNHNRGMMQAGCLAMFTSPEYDRTDILRMASQ